VDAALPEVDASVAFWAAALRRDAGPGRAPARRRTGAKRSVFLPRTRRELV